MKVCSLCNLELPLESFAKKLNSLQSRCRKCHALYTQEHYQKNKSYYVKKARKHSNKTRKETKLFVLNYLQSHPCVDCGESDPVVLEFDHVRGTKRREVSTLLHFSMKSVVDEIAKCEVRCANCHRRKTAKQFGWNKF